MSARFIRIYSELKIFLDFENELSELKNEAIFLLSKKPLDRPEYIEKKGVVKISIEDAVTKLEEHLIGKKRDLNEINSYNNETIYKLFVLLNKWIPRKRNLNNYLLNMDRTFGENYININKIDDEGNNYKLPFNERVVLLRDNYVQMEKWAKASLPM